MKINRGKEIIIEISEIKEKQQRNLTKPRLRGDEVKWPGDANMRMTELRGRSCGHVKGFIAAVILL